MRWAIVDAWTITRRDLTHWARQPGAVITNTVLFPIMIVLMFAYLLGGAMTVPGGGDYKAFLLPGMFAMTMLFGIGATLVAVSTDAARGVTDRFRSVPMSRSAVVVGRAFADMLNSTAALAVLHSSGTAEHQRERTSRSPRRADQLRRHGHGPAGVDPVVDHAAPGRSTPTTGRQFGREHQGVPERSES